jgi:hypothetical protein
MTNMRGILDTPPVILPAARAQGSLEGCKHQALTPVLQHMDDSVRRLAEQDGIDEQELIRRFYERLSDWSEPGAVKVNRSEKLLGSIVVRVRVELRKQIFKLSWARPNC